ncbi:uncharacterized protein LOC102675942 [Apis dorsata]|uniref:uncharacterized protein LOC102675942 n=1 Tax=Apis dorsata TaxID=7462 RepID=UPI0003DF71EF|nr:uncharacterized protein LOC102675942 [Apis dorsata]
MKLSVSAYRAQASAHKKILSNYQHQLSYGATNQASSARTPSDPATFLTGFKGLSAKCGSSDVSILWIVRRTRRAREGVVCRRLRRAAAVLPEIGHILLMVCQKYWMERVREYCCNNEG